MHKKSFALVLAVFVCILAMQGGVLAADTTGHVPRFAPGATNNNYSPPQFGSIDLPDSGLLAYPYADGRFSLAVDAPKTVYVNEPFSISVDTKSLMTGLDDPDWGYWIHYPQMFVPSGIAAPTAWTQQLNCVYSPGEPIIQSGSIASVSPEWMLNPAWFDAGVLSYPHTDGTVVVGTNMILSHKMGPWIWLQDSDETIWDFSSFVADKPGDYTFELCFTDNLYGDRLRDEWWVDYEPVRFTVRVIDKTVPAQLQINPNTLNTKSKGTWISATIEAPGCDISRTDLSTVKLNGVIADPKFFDLSDRDFDGVQELTIKFSRDAIIGSLAGKGDIGLSVTGSAGGLKFTGADVIRVI